MTWTLKYTGTEISFGDGLSTGYALQREPEVADYEIRYDDAYIPRDDGIFFGSDSFAGRTIRLDMSVHADTEAEVRAMANVVQAAWRFDSGRNTPGAVAELIAPSGRRVFGRPRRISQIDINAMFGRIDFVADFQTVDANWYGAEQSASLSITSLPSGGMTSPFVEPFSTTRTADSGTVITVGGSGATSPIFQIHGPITNPAIEIGGNTIALNRTLAEDQIAIIDTRAWKRSAMIGSRSIAGSLTAKSTRLSAVGLRPGNHELALRGSSSTGTAFATVRWRDTFATY